MTTYRITNRASGADLGTYDAADPMSACAAMWRDAGYATPAAAAEALGDDEDDLYTELRVVEEFA